MEHLSKNKKLILGLFFDVLGMASYVFPLADVIWAPLSAYLMLKMYKGDVGKIGGVISFLEEAIPGFDFIPSFSLTWIYVYVIRKRTVT